MNCHELVRSKYPADEIVAIHPIHVGPVASQNASHIHQPSLENDECLSRSTVQLLPHKQVRDTCSQLFIELDTGVQPIVECLSDIDNITIGNVSCIDEHSVLVTFSRYYRA